MSETNPQSDLSHCRSDWGPDSSCLPRWTTAVEIKLVMKTSTTEEEIKYIKKKKKTIWYMTLMLCVSSFDCFRFYNWCVLNRILRSRIDDITFSSWKFMSKKREIKTFQRETLIDEDPMWCTKPHFFDGRQQQITADSRHNSGREAGCITVANDICAVVSSLTVAEASLHF